MSDCCTQMATKPLKEVIGPAGRFDRNQEATWILRQTVESGRYPDFPILDADGDWTERGRKTPADALIGLQESP